MEAACKIEMSKVKTPSLELAGGTQLPESTNCLACSGDGRYLSLGHSRGLSVWCASSLVCAAEWLQDRLEITSIQMTRTSEMTYLLSTVDDMGVARVFAYHSEHIYLLSVINVMDNINKRSICLTFELSEGGDYGAASMSCYGALWLEVYHFPLEAWLKELEMAPSKKQDANSSGEVDVKWSPVAAVLKVKPLKPPAGTGLEGPREVLQMTDLFTHCLVLDEGTSSSYRCGEQCFNDAGKAKDTTESRRCCTHHFLLPCSSPGYSKAKSHPAGSPVSVCVWWSGSHNLCHYLLQRPPKNKPDVDPAPDVLWPNAQEILCSAVSGCTRYVALGLAGALVCVWDRQSGSPLSVVTVTAADSAFFRMQFVDYWPLSAGDFQTLSTAEVHLLVLCKSGALHTVITGRGTESCTMPLTERPKDSRDVPSVTASVPFLQSLSLVVQRNGKMFLQDVTNKTTVCFLSPPITHLIATPCSPVYALNTEQQSLFIKGDVDTSCRASPEEGRQSQLFIFNFGECDIMKQYIVSPIDYPQQQGTLSCVSLEETCDFYLKQRALSAGERNKALRQAWKQLQETAVVIQQRQSDAAAS